MLTVKCLLIHPHSEFLEWFQGGVIQILPTCCGAGTVRGKDLVSQRVRVHVAVWYIDGP